MRHLAWIGISLVVSGIGCLCVACTIQWNDPGEDAFTSVFDNTGRPVFMDTSVKYLIGSQDSDIQLFNMYDWRSGQRCTVFVSKPGTFAQRCAPFFVGE